MRRVVEFHFQRDLGDFGKLHFSGGLAPFEDNHFNDSHVYHLLTSKGKGCTLQGIHVDHRPFAHEEFYV